MIANSVAELQLMTDSINAAAFAIQEKAGTTVILGRLDEIIPDDVEARRLDSKSTTFSMEKDGDMMVRVLAGGMVFNDGLSVHERISAAGWVRDDEPGRVTLYVVLDKH